jgi:50S ribosomal protein L16 3-hydroxylase
VGKTAFDLMATVTARGRRRKVRVDSVQAAQLFALGATLAFNRLHRSSGLLGEWMRGLARELGIPPGWCHCSAYLSPAGSGLPKHFDPHAVIVVQVIGRKSWRLAPNTNVVHPMEGHYAPNLSPRTASYSVGRVTSTMPRRSQRVAMRPGSALFVPAAYWHTTRAIDASLSVTFGLQAPRWLDLVSEAVAERLEGIASWREPAWGLRGDATQRASARRRLDSLLSGLIAEIGQLRAETLLSRASVDLGFG